MGTNWDQMNGDSGEQSSQLMITTLSRELSNAKREHQLCEQIRQQLYKISKTRAQNNEITTRLLYQSKGLTEKEVQELHQKERQIKTTLEKEEQRLKMLEEIESNVCELNIRFLSAKKTNKTNVLMIEKKEIRIDSSNGTVVREDREESEQRGRSRGSSEATEVDTIDSRFSYELEGELKDLSIKRTGGRKRAVPERFESFPGKRKSLRGLNGILVAIIAFVVLFGILFALIELNFIQFDYKSFVYDILKLIKFPETLNRL